MNEREQKALEICRELRIVSIPSIMMGLDISYPEANRIISNLEAGGHIGPWQPGGVRLISDGRGGWF